ncbi:DUF2493 domain-containing protein [Bradyrhizobium oligotrophicum S58]
MTSPALHRVLVCGGRDFTDANRIWSVLDHYLREADDFECLIQGEARGADRIAGEWADARSVRVLPFPADWNGLGNAAGAIRNAQMLREGRPTMVIAFPGGRGTADMVDRAKRAGVPVLEISRG